MISTTLDLAIRRRKPFKLEFDFGHFVLSGSLSTSPRCIAVQTSSLPAIIYSVTCDIILLIFFRWRLQKAFFTPQSVGSHGCRGISCKEFFPVLSSFPCCCIKHDLDTYPLKITDLKTVIPEYVNNVAIDSWPRHEILLPSRWSHCHHAALST